LAIDAAGNMFICEMSSNRVRKVDTAGVITTVVGTGISGLTGDGGPAVSATLNFPAGIRFDSLGNLIIADQGNNVIRKVDTLGIITTIAGTGGRGFSGDGGSATLAEIGGPFGLALGSDDSIYFADVTNSVVRKIDPSGIITTVAGNGTATGSIDGEGRDPTDDLGDGGLAITASLRFPRGVLLDSSGNLYITDIGNHRVRKVNSSGVITTVAGNGLPGFDGDDGPAVAARIGNPRGLALDSSGNLLITNAGGPRVRRVDLSSGIITTTAGSGVGFNGDGNTALSTSFLVLTDILVDTFGNMLLADSANGRIRKIDAVSGIVTTLAGGVVGDGNPATSAGLSGPADVALDSMGNIYVADQFNNRVRKVDTSGIITTFAGTGLTGFSADGDVAASAPLFLPFGVVVDSSGDVFITDRSIVRKVDTSGIIAAFAGDGNFGNGGDGGPATSASFGDPISLNVDSLDNLYIVDQWFCVIRKVDTSGTISTVAGDGTCGFGGDGGPATSAQLNGPLGVALDSAGNIYIADTFNHRIRKVDTTSGTITTLAGNGTCDFSGDDGPAASAGLCFPTDVGSDIRFGNVFIADNGNLRIRRVNSSGMITTVSGNGEFGFSGDGGPAADARWGDPYALALDTLGNIYVTDGVFYRVRKITADPAQVIGELINLVESFNLQQGIANSLDAKLQNAFDALEAANASQRQDAVNKLQAFINGVEAQRGKVLTDAQADQLLALAQSILSVL
jgi:sugar lactone lactonase YvrE